MHEKHVLLAIEQLVQCYIPQLGTQVGAEELEPIIRVKLVEQLEQMLTPEQTSHPDTLHIGRQVLELLMV